MLVEPLANYEMNWVSWYSASILPDEKVNSMSDYAEGELRSSLHISEMNCEWSTVGVLVVHDAFVII